MDINTFIDSFKSELDNEDALVNPDTDFANAEFWDSLTNMAITVMLEDDYNVKMSFEELNDFSSVQELYDFVINKQK